MEDDPAFLRGYGKHASELEPVKVVKNPDGSLAQAALMQVEFSISNALFNPEIGRLVQREAGCQDSVAERKRC